MNSEVRLLVLSLVLSFVVTVIAGYFVVRILRKKNAGQSIREEGPESHKSKAGTPTMGGFMFLIGIVVTSFGMSLAVHHRLTADIVILTVSLLLCALIGFSDDFVKVIKKRNLGLTAKQKLLFQIVIAAVIAVYQSRVSDYGTSLYIPIVKTWLDLGVLYIPFVIFVLVAMTNAVNLNDGLDGLAGGCVGMVAMFLALMALRFGNHDTLIYTAAVAGGCAGFLVYNHHPAKVFMGDTGSLALGGALAVAAAMMHIELILVIAGMTFVLEALSVIIQVGVFKMTKDPATGEGRRVFAMAPLHHHFEKGGWRGKKEEAWKETKVVAFFWAWTLIFCVIAWFMM